MRKATVLSAYLIGIALTSTHLGASSLQVNSGKLWINGAIAKTQISLSINPFKYLYVYVPGHGLVTVSNHEFPGASDVGKFSPGEISFDLNGVNGTLRSSDSSLSEVSGHTYAKLDASFHSDSKTVVLGFGDTEMIPYDRSNLFR